MKRVKTSEARSKHGTTCDIPLDEEELSNVIKIKEQEVKQLQQKVEKLRQVEVLCQREKEYLLDQCKHVFDEQHGDLSATSRPSSDINTGKRSHNEVYNLVKEIHQQKQENQKLLYQIHEAEAFEEMKNIYNAIANMKQDESIHPESLLQKWLKAMKRQRHSSRGTKIPLTDKLFYNVKYQDVQQDPVHGTVSARQTSSTRSLPSHALEMVSFDTRHNGICVGVMVARVIQDEYIIMTDPYFDNSENAAEFVCQCKPVEFVQQVVWKYIDTIST